MVGGEAEPDEDVLAVQRELRRVLQGLRRRPLLTPALVPRFRAARLGPRHVGALAVIARDEGLTVGGVARQLGVSLAAASQLVGELSAAGLVERREDELDRRRTLVTVHDERRSQVRDWLAVRGRPIAAALARLDDAEREAFVRGLAALAEELEAGAAARAPVGRRSVS
jgi:DNA-binding MarR family transcriptional regulator